MELHAHRFSIGRMNGLIVADDLSPTQEENIRSIIPSVTEDAMQFYRDHPETHFFSRNVLYLEGNGQRILIDTGLGFMNPNKTGWTMETLKAEGVDSEAVQTIVITHLHGDHFGGLLDQNNELRFPNAQLCISKKEWDYWMYDPSLPAERVARLRPGLMPFADTIRFFEPDERITPELCVVSLPGHTPAHIGLMIESDGQQLFHVADALHLALQARYPELSPGFDSQPEVSPVTRRNALARAADEKLWMLAYHLPFPGLGYATRDGDAFAWTPAGEASSE